MIVVTAGRKYIDIDAYASMIAYRELLRVTTDKKALAISTSKMNQTVPPMLRSLKYTLDKPVDTEKAKFVLLDVSNQISLVSSLIQIASLRSSTIIQATKNIGARIKL